MKFSQRTIEFCQSYELLAEGGNLLIAVSGGADSVALFHVLKTLKDSGQIKGKLFAGHVNHNLRGDESDGDEEFVKSLSKTLGIECVTRSVDVKAYAESKKLSIETAAREVRIGCLMNMADSLGCERIATAHHADDNAETIIHRMLRGTGFKGLCGIQPETEFSLDGRPARFIRPMLGVTKADILAYCRDNDIEWRHDHTNDEFDFTRNKIRHLVIPYLLGDAAVGRMPIERGKLISRLGLLSSNCQRLYERINAKIGSVENELFKDSDGSVSIDGGLLKELSPVVQAEAVRTALVRIGCGLRFVTRFHYEQIISLVDGPGGKVIELPGGFTAKLEFGNIVLHRPAESDDTTQGKEKVELMIPGTVEFGGFKITAEVLDSSVCDLEKFIAEKKSNVEWFDMDKIVGPVYVRRRKEADRFVPIGTKSFKKVGKFLTAEKVDYQLRDNIIVFEDDERIVWVGPVRACENTRVTGCTDKVLAVEICSV